MLDRDTFLGLCEEPARAFFASLLDDAVSHGMTIRWGTKSFSVRADMGKTRTVIYAWHSGKLDIVTSGWTASAEDLEAFLGRPALAPFAEARPKTFRLQLNKQTIPAAREAVEELNRTLYRHAQALARQADSLSRRNFEEEAEKFVRALACDLILPMDF